MPRCHSLIIKGTNLGAKRAKVMKYDWRLTDRACRALELTPSLHSCLQWPGERRCSIAELGQLVVILVVLNDQLPGSLESQLLLITKQK